MSSLGNRTAILTLTRLAGYGLMLISPVVLVRLLSVEQFGHYREFLLYASILQAFAVFSINDSLLYCMPACPESPWRVVRQTAFLILCNSSLVVLALLLIDTAMGGKLVHGFVLPLAAYTMFSVNLDFWEYFWLASRRPGAVFVYSGCRLLVRICVVVGAAVASHEVSTIVWSLVALEAIRLVGATVAFLALDRSRDEPPLADPWRGQLRFCVPSGLASLLALLNSSLSNLVVARFLGPIALARYSVGRFCEPVVVTLRNSISTVLLPEMVRKDRQARESPLALWQRATVVNTIFLFPLVVLITRYAQPLIVAVFGASYRPSALVMQIYMLVFIRECFDFAPALRAINRAGPLVVSNLAAIAVCALAMLALVPFAGIAGAVTAVVISRYVDVGWLWWRTMKLYAVGVREILPWASIGKTALAAVCAGAVIVSPIWTEAFGLLGIILSSSTYLAAFALLLVMLRVPEALTLLVWLKRLVPVQATTSRKV